MDKKLKAAIDELWQKVQDMAQDGRLTQAELLMILAEVEKRIADSPSPDKSNHN